MKAPGTHGVGDRRTDDERTPRRAPRREEQGPIGFGQVMSLVKRGAGAKGTQAKAGKKQAATGERQATRKRRTGEHGEGGAVGTAATPHGAGAGRGPAGTPGVGSVARRTVVQEAVAVPSALLVDARAVYGSALQTVGADALATAHAQQSNQAQHGLMTPGLALHLAAEEAREMNAWRDARELDLSLEPEHLGPLLIRIRTERGRIRAELIVREKDAASLLARDSEGLREKLAALGYADAEVVVSQREPEFFVQPQA